MVLEVAGTYSKRDVDRGGTMVKSNGGVCGRHTVFLPALSQRVNGVQERSDKLKTGASLSRYVSTGAILTSALALYI